jgi:hypothetical protein
MGPVSNPVSNKDILPGVVLILPPDNQRKYQNILTENIRGY